MHVRFKFNHSFKSRVYNAGDVGTEQVRLWQTQRLPDQIDNNLTNKYFCAHIMSTSHENYFKNGATRCQILQLKCSKFDFRRVEMEGRGGRNEGLTITERERRALRGKG